MTAATSTKFPTGPLLTMAAATFISITIEMLPTGLMHLMAPDLQVAESQIGLLMTVFAFTVVVTSTPLMLLLRRVPKRILLVSVLVIFAFTAIATAFAPTYFLVLVTRVFNGVAHGVFWASVTAYTGTLVRPERLTMAVSITGGGGGLAFVLGVPLGTLLGQLFGWRLTFAVLAGICLLVALLMWRVLPKGANEPPVSTSPIETQPAPQAIGDTSGVGRGISVPPRPKRSMRWVTLVCILVTLIMTGHYAYYTYISPYLLGPVALPAVWLPAALFGFGIASAIATPLTGLLFTGRSTLGFYVSFGLFILGGGVLTLFPGELGLVVPALMLWGLGMGFLPTLLQSRLLAVAPSKQRDLASALFTSAFNLGIGAGAYFGGTLLDEFGLRSLGAAFLVFIFAAVLLSIFVDLSARKARRAENV